MENSPTVIRPPPPPTPPSPAFFPSPPRPLSQSDNTTNSTMIPSPPPPLAFASSPQIYPIDQNGNITIVTVNPPPPFSDAMKSVDLSPLEFIIALMVVITIPAIVYAFFFAINCPPWSSSERRRDSSIELPRDNRGSSIEVIERREPISGLKYIKETHSKDIGHECSVCLSVFVDGEEVKQLNGCKHSFHAICIDLWLNNHDNCPICRDNVTVKRPNNNRRRRESDHRRALPDAANLV